MSIRWLLIALALASAGCARGQSGMSETALLELGTAERDRLAQPAPLYCYRTRAEADCLAAPLPGEEGRLIGAYLPAPAP